MERLGPYGKGKGKLGKGKSKKGEEAGTGQKGKGDNERQNRGWSQQRRAGRREEDFATEARTALAQLEEHRCELMGCREEESRLPWARVGGGFEKTRDEAAAASGGSS